MITLNILSKLVRSRSQIALSTRNFVTSKPRWREKGEFSDKFKKCPPVGGSKREERVPEKQDKGCGVIDDEPKQSKKHNVNKKQKSQKCCPTEVDEYLESKKQGVSSSCGTVETTNKETCKVRGLETDVSPKDKACGRVKSRGSSCPPYDTPKYAKETREQKNMTGCKQMSKEQNECAPKQRKPDPCETKKPKCPAKENQPGRGQEDEKCLKENNPNRSNYCGPEKTSYKDSCPDNKDICLKDSKQSTKNQDIKCGETVNPCKQTKTSSSSCPEELDCANVKKKTSHPCPDDRNKKEIKIPELSTCCKVDAANECICKLKELEREWKEVIATQEKERKDGCQQNTCPEVKEDKCLDEKKENPCPEQRCKKEIKIPELSPCCKVDAAKECICKLKELEREWEEVIATQEREKKDECQQNTCPGVKEEKCLDEKKENPCPEQRCKKEIKIPELSPCCKVDAAQECVCKLKELETEWDKVITIQKKGGKDECLKSRESGKGCGGTSSKTSRSNLIYVFLVAILATVIYYTYNEDFETEELFLTNNEMEEEDTDDDDDD